MSKSHTRELQFDEIGGRGLVRTGLVAAPGAAAWLSLAAAPTFAVMALLTGVQSGGQPDIFCSAMPNASPLVGMVPMYMLMAAFHLSPWLKLISRRRRLGRRRG